MDKKNKKPIENKGEIIIYRAKDGEAKLEVNLRDETIWLTQKQISTLFDVNIPAISKHIKNIYKDGELSEKSTVSILETVQKEGKRSIRRNVEFFNLDMALSIGYRVNSQRATQFRIWATKTLHDHLIKGYTIDKKRLQQRDAKLQELEKVIRLFQAARQSKLLDQSEANGLLHVITQYANSWILLQKYDQEKITLTTCSA